MKSSIVLLVTATVAFTFADVYELKWKEFKETYNKVYSSVDEENYRFKIFSENLRKISEHNKLFEEGKTTYKMEVNQFADLTEKEYEDILRGILKTGYNEYSSLTYTPNDEFVEQWENFKERYNKLYTAEEEAYRYKIFSEQLRKINEHNKLYEEGKSTYKMGVNQYTDLTSEEYQHMLGVKGKVMDKNVNLLNISEQTYQEEWINYKEKFGKFYSTNEEEGWRFKIFCSSLDKITEHNKKYKLGLTTFKMGLNMFSDMTEKEIQEHMGLRNKNLESGNNEYMVHSDDDSCQNEWLKFKANFQKIYSSKGEEDRHFNTFCSNLQVISENNKLYQKGLSTFKMGINQFADLTKEEFKQHMGYRGSNGNCNSEWIKFKDTYGKSYSTSDEEEIHFKIFCRNLREVKAHNQAYKEGKTTFKMAINKFSDMTAEEIKKHMGLLPNKTIGDDEIVVFLSKNNELKNEYMLHVYEDTCQNEWNKFKANFQKIYSSKSEEDRHFNTFCSNLQVILENNKLYQKGLSTFKMGINQFADLTKEEFKQHMGYRRSNGSCASAWIKFKDTYGKAYSTSDEDEIHFKIFCRNLREVKAHNQAYKEGKTTFKMAINKFSDMTPEEIKKHMGFGPNKTISGDEEVVFLSKNNEVENEYILHLYEDTCQNEWNKFKANYQKIYSSKGEEETHFNTFCSNLQVILENNNLYQKGLATFKMGINQFADLTKEEFKQHMGYRRSNGSCASAWIKFKDTYGKSYSTSDEDEIHFKIFCRNLREVKAHNQAYKEGKTTFKMAINKFSDMTPEEIKKHMGFGPNKTIGGDEKVVFLSKNNEVENEYMLHLYEDTCQNEWNKFKANYQKIYSSKGEEETHFNTFCSNLQIISVNNKRYEEGLVTFKMGINQFADLTKEEFKQHMGYRRQQQQGNCNSEWVKFKGTFGKSYSTSDEENIHFNIFCQNLREVDAHNQAFKEGKTTFEMEINKFSDMTAEEIKRYLGFLDNKNSNENKIISENAYTDRLNEYSCQDEWTKFKANFQKVYSSEEAEEVHFETFCTNLQRISENNKLYEQGLVTSKMGINKFADLTKEEFEQYMGYHGKRQEGHCAADWINFKGVFGKQYLSHSEETYRYGIFCNNLAKIEQHNSMYDQGLTTYRMTVNKFSDITEEEFEADLHRGLHY